MAELFSTTQENILMHLKNIYQEGELNEKATTKDFLVVRQEGSRQVKRNLKHYYNLDAIIYLVPTLLRGNAYLPNILHCMHSHRGRWERENWIKMQLPRITRLFVRKAFG